MNKLMLRAYLKGYRDAEVGKVPAKNFWDFYGSYRKGYQHGQRAAAKIN